jgi:hypothetical protein
MAIVSAGSTNLFVGTEDAPRQVVRVTLRGDSATASAPAQVRIEGSRIRTAEPVTVGPLGPGEEARLEVGVGVDPAAVAGERFDVEVVQLIRVDHWDCSFPLSRRLAARYAR